LRDDDGVVRGAAECAVPPFRGGESGRVQDEFFSFRVPACFQLDAANIAAVAEFGLYGRISFYTKITKPYMSIVVYVPVRMPQ
jgi:hypothetical protein